MAPNTSGLSINLVVVKTTASGAPSEEHAEKAVKVSAKSGAENVSAAHGCDITDETSVRGEILAVEACGENTKHHITIFE